MTDVTDIDTRSITDLRCALIAESEDCHQRCQQFREPMKNGDQTALDAYEGLVGTGTYAWLVAGILRRLEQEHPETAAVVAGWVEASLDSGMDWLEDLNDDLDNKPAATAEVGA